MAPRRRMGQGLELCEVSVANGFGVEVYEAAPDDVARFTKHQTASSAEAQGLTEELRRHPPRSAVLHRLW